MPKTSYEKTPLAISDQIKNLKGKKLLFENVDKAEHFLINNNFYRFSGYARSFRLPNPPNNFKKNTYFGDIVSLYQFDSRFRLFVLENIEKIEISIRTQIINQYSLTFGSHWHSDSKYFKDQNEHTNYLNALNASLQRSSDESVVHYLKTYDSPKLPPCWLCFEIMTFGQLFSLYGNLDDSKPCKLDIANHFGFSKTKDFIQWMRLLYITRNICAHHGRLWNKSFPVDIWSHQNIQNSFVNNVPEKRTKVYSLLCAIQYFLDVINKDNTFRAELRSILHSLSQKNSAMGFPADWENDPFWAL